MIRFRVVGEIPDRADSRALLMPLACISAISFSFFMFLSSKVIMIASVVFILPRKGGQGKKFSQNDSEMEGWKGKTRKIP